jgi:PAS domain S-box-containing protein
MAILPAQSARFARAGPLTPRSVKDDRTPTEGASAGEPAGSLVTHPEAWLAAIVESSDDAIVGKTLDSLIRSWNRGAQRIFGYESAEIVGKPVYVLIPPERHYEEPEIIGRLIRGERVDHYETVRVRKDGSPIDVSLSVSPIRDPAGRIIGAAKVARDVTEAKRLQRAERELLDQLQELTSELEQQIEEAQSLQEEVEQANNELANSLADAEEARELADAARREADEARRVAEQANAAKGQFLATMSHELRTPLNAIVGYTDILEVGVHGPLTEEQREDVRRIRRSEAMLHRLVEHVLSFARLESGKVDYRYEDVVLDRFLATLEGFIAPRLAHKGLEYRLECSATSVTVSIDRDKVEQIMLNLLSNAVKFTDHGTIGVRCVVSENTFTIEVTDTGRGVRESLLDSIFEPFTQGDRTLTRTSEGTGLGLSISRQLARAMGGDITVKSLEGRGSTFAVCLPRRRS